MVGEGYTGVIDRFEGEWAVVIFDDGQELAWPRGRLPAGVRPGSVVCLVLHPPEEGEVWEAGVVSGEVDREVGGVRVEGQVVRWPEELDLGEEGRVLVYMKVDEEETERRRRRVRGLIDRLFR